MGGVGVEESAAIGAEHLDGFLRSGGALGDGLNAAFEGGDFGVRMKVLDAALGDQDERCGDRERDQQVERGAGDIHPEVADGVGGAAGESAHHGHGAGDAGGGRSEVMHRQARPSG